MKLIIYSSVTVCGIIGSYLPVWLFGSDIFSILSILGGAIGSVVGVFVGYKIGQSIE